MITVVAEAERSRLMLVNFIFMLMLMLVKVKVKNYVREAAGSIPSGGVGGKSRGEACPSEGFVKVQGPRC